MAEITYKDNQDCIDLLETPRTGVINILDEECDKPIPSWFPCRLFLGPGFRLGACWNRLVETVKTRKKREKTGEKWARYSLKGVKEGS